jgi:hypothetical protein
MSFTNATTLDDRGTLRPSSFGMGPMGGSSNSEMERLLETKEEEILQLKNKLEIIQIEMVTKDGHIESIKEENEQLQEKNKKWITKLD